MTTQPASGKPLKFVPASSGTASLLGRAQSFAPGLNIPNQQPAPLERSTSVPMWLGPAANAGGRGVQDSKGSRPPTASPPAKDMGKAKNAAPVRQNSILPTASGSKSEKNAKKAEKSES